MKLHAIITARGGSKGLPRKNLRLFRGEPLIAHTIRAAQNSNRVDRCCVSTEDAEIRALSLQAGALVIDRPAELATDTALSSDVVKHALEWLSAAGDRPDAFALLQPTSPLRTASHLADCIDMFRQHPHGSVVSVVRTEHHPYKMLARKDGVLEPIFGHDWMELPRQGMPEVFRQNGAIYVLSTDDFLKQGTFCVDPIKPYVMDGHSSVDIDTELDLQLAELIARESPGSVTTAAPFAGVSRTFGKPMDFRAIKRDVSWRIDVSKKQREIADRMRSYSGRVEACPICEGASDSLAEIHGYEYKRCDACRHIFCASPPDPEAVWRLYGGERGERTIQGTIYLDEPIFRERVQRIARPKVAFVRECVAPAGSWVDVGSGAGEILVAAREAGWLAKGLEADKDEVAFARSHGMDVVQEYLRPDNARNLLSGASVVSFFNVLEHVPNPVALLRSASAALDQHAHVVIEVPRDPSLSSLTSLAFRELASRHIYPPDHLHVFTEQSLRGMLDAAGLSAIALWTFGQDYYDLVTCVAATTRTGTPDLYDAALAIAPQVQQIVDEAGLSDTVLVVCKKRLLQR